MTTLRLGSPVLRIEFPTCSLNRYHPDSGQALLIGCGLFPEENHHK